MMKPPHMPTKSAMMVSSGSMTQVAIRRGVTSFWTGSVPSARMASICSVTFIEPSSLAMPEALRPATISAGQHRSEFAHQGERNERAGLADLPVRAPAPCDICSAITAPPKKPVMPTIVQAADADDVHLHEDVVGVMGRAEDVANGSAGEEKEVLNRGDKPFERIEQVRAVLEPRCYHRTADHTDERTYGYSREFASATFPTSARSPAARRSCASRARSAAWTFAARATGTEEIATLDPGHVTDRIHGILLAGGSAFGLEAASGVRRYLERRGVGYRDRRGEGADRARRDPVRSGDRDARTCGRSLAMGEAAAAAATAEAVKEGCVGAGTGATVGKMFGMKQAMKSGLGSFTVTLPDGVLVSSLVAVNALGDVRDPATGKIVAGARRAADSREFADTEEQMKRGARGGSAHRATRRWPSSRPMRG